MNSSMLPLHSVGQVGVTFQLRRDSFQTPGEKAVTNAWRVYSDHLNNRYPENELARWVEDGEKLLAKLLFELSLVLGYEFDEVQLRRNVYSPIAHGKEELQLLAIRDGIEKLLTHKSALAVVTYDPPTSGPSASPPPPGTPPQLPGGGQPGSDLKK